jgi:hypothetical protein
VARMLWLRRNNFVFERGFSAPGQVVVFARRAVEEFLQATTISVAPASRGFAVGWTTPSLGILKINWDAAFDSVNMRVGIGVVNLW